MPKNNQIFPKTKPFPLNPAQKAAAEAPKTPLLIVAGAGTGKTRTLTSRIIHLIDTGTDPSRICAITFTNKAAKEMLRRLPGQPELFIGTFHSLGARILRRESSILGRGPNFVIFDDHDSFELIKKIVKKHGLTEKDKKNTPSFFAQKISELKNLGAAQVDEAATGLTGKQDRAAMERMALASHVFEEYEAALARNNAFDFDDLIGKPVLLWQKNAAALKKYQNKFDAILIDEYQDINPKQYEFVKLLAQAHRNLSVVGDDEQTIYSWRYADIRTFLNFDKDWPGAKVYFLEENYRSTSTVIDAAQAVAEHNRFRTPKKLWTGNPEGERIKLFEAWGENDEAAWIVDGLKTLKAAGGEFSQSAILYRTNAQSRAIEQALIRHEIPYQIFGGLKFYERREVKDAIAALRWAMNERDELARERLEKNLTKKKFAAFANKMGAAMRGPTGITPKDAIKIFLEAFGYFDYLEDNFLNSDEREENIAELIGFAEEFSDLPDFIEKVTLLQATDDENNPAKSREKVNLMTIHLAKGLEFENVFIAGASEGLLPHVRSIEREASLEEERRLMYVAMTRAKNKLHISFYGMPSRFVSEIPEKYLSLAPGGATMSGASGTNAAGVDDFGDDAEDDQAWHDDASGENVIQW